MASLTCPPESHTLFSSSLQDFSLIAPAFLTYAKYKLLAVLQSNGVHHVLGAQRFKRLQHSDISCFPRVPEAGLRNFLEKRTLSSKRVVSGIGQEMWKL